MEDDMTNETKIRISSLGGSLLKEEFGYKLVV